MLKVFTCKYLHIIYNDIEKKNYSIKEVQLYESLQLALIVKYSGTAIILIKLILQSR